MVTKNKQKSSKRSYYVYAALIILVIIGAVIAIGGSRDYSAFAGCLAEKGWVMAGTEWCPHCKNQKSLFNGAFEDVIIPAGAYKDCDAQKQWCQENQITGYPTWITPDGHRLSGVQELATLERVSGCSLSS